MKLIRQTISYCTICYKEIPASVHVEPFGVVMRKTCNVHGSTEAMLERDPLFWVFCSTNPIGKRIEGHLTEVTRRCNMRCGHCFYPLVHSDPEGLFTVDEIVNECRVNAHHAPLFILTGGEPTIHPNIVELIDAVKRVGPVELLSNGVKLAEQKHYEAIVPKLVDDKGIAHINLSIHYKESDDWQGFVGRLLADKLKLASALIVIEDKDSFLEAIQICKEVAPVTRMFRIKAATKVWAEKSTPDRVFVSDMLHWLEELGSVDYIWPEQSRAHRFNVVFEKKMHLQLISWQDVSNVDLSVPNERTGRALNGQVVQFMQGFVINEGIEKGWLAGRPLPTPKIVHEDNPVAVTG